MIPSNVDASLPRNDSLPYLLSGSILPVLPGAMVLKSVLPLSSSSFLGLVLGHSPFVSRPLSAV